MTALEILEKIILTEITPGQYISEEGIDFEIIGPGQFIIGISGMRYKITTPASQLYISETQPNLQRA